MTHVCQTQRTQIFYLEAEIFFLAQSHPTSLPVPTGLKVKQQKREREREGEGGKGGRGRNKIKGCRREQPERCKKHKVKKKSADVKRKEGFFLGGSFNFWCTGLWKMLYFYIGFLSGGSKKQLLGGP